MEYKLYTLVDITHTGQYRHEPGKEHLRLKEQNFNTVIQTLGIRSNITYNYPPAVLDIKGKLVGFDTDETLKLWRFDFNTDRDHFYEDAGDPVAHLNSDFHLVPYIQGLDENMEQKYAVFNTSNPGKNIVFHRKL